jgi:hypothetical protein
LNPGDSGAFTYLERATVTRFRDQQPARRTSAAERWQDGWDALRRRRSRATPIAGCCAQWSHAANLVPVGRDDVVTAQRAAIEFHWDRLGVSLRRSVREARGANAAHRRGRHPPRSASIHQWCRASVCSAAAFARVLRPRGRWSRSAPSAARGRERIDHLLVEVGVVRAEHPELIALVPSRLSSTRSTLMLVGARQIR